MSGPRVATGVVLYAARVLTRSGWLAAVGAAALVIIAAATRVGVGISADSVTYIAEARALREGRGVGVPAGIYSIYEDAPADEDIVAGPHFPPLFPAVLAAAGAWQDPGSSGRPVDAVLFVVSVLALAVMIERYSGSRLVASLAAGMTALSAPVLEAYGMVWSEPLFIALGLIGLLALSTYVERGRPWTLRAGALAVGLAWLTRYAGVGFVLTGLVVLVATGAARRRRQVVTFLGVSCLPTLGYLAAMRLAGRAGGGYTLDPHRPTASVLRQGWESLREWILPVGTPRVLPLLMCLPLAGAGALLARVTRSRHNPSVPRLPHLPLVLAVFLLVYGTVLLASVAAFAESVPLDTRMLVPAYVAAVALAACGVSRLRGRRLFVRAPVLGLVAAIAVGTVAGGWSQLHRGAPDYPSFTSSVWTSSALLRRTSALPTTARVYSNFPDAVYLATGRGARLLPKYVLAGAKLNLDYAAQLARVVDEVRHGDAVAVVFAAPGRGQVTDGPALAARLGAPAAVDGIVWEWGAAATVALMPSGPSPTPRSP